MTTQTINEQRTDSTTEAVTADGADVKGYALQVTRVEGVAGPGLLFQIAPRYALALTLPDPPHGPAGAGDVQGFMMSEKIKERKNAGEYADGSGTSWGSVLDSAVGIAIFIALL